MRMALIADDSAAAADSSIPSGIATVCVTGMTTCSASAPCGGFRPPKPTVVPSGRRPMPSKRGIARSAPLDGPRRAGPDAPTSTSTRCRRFPVVTRAITEYFATSRTADDLDRDVARLVLPLPDGPR
jgi:hypothetical protein